jgi:hypothetical protein
MSASLQASPSLAKPNFLLISSPGFSRLKLRECLHSPSTVFRYYRKSCNTTGRHQLPGANCVTFCRVHVHIWAILIDIARNSALAIICSLTNFALLSGRIWSLSICKLPLMRFDLTNCSIPRIEHAFSHKPFNQRRHIVLAALFNTDLSRSAKFTSNADLMRA